MPSQQSYREIGERDAVKFHRACRPALFLDRDGVVNEEIGYLHRIEDCRFVEGIFELVARARGKGFMTVIVTNQSGIGKGYFSQTQYDYLMDWMLAEFAKNDAEIDAVYHCPDKEVDHVDLLSSCRKPSPFMFLKAKSELRLCLDCSVMVGDRISDVVAAAAAGIQQCYLLSPAPLTGDSMIVGDLSAVKL